MASERDHEEKEEGEVEEVERQHVTLANSIMAGSQSYPRIEADSSVSCRELQKCAALDVSEEKSQV